MSTQTGLTGIIPDRGLQGRMGTFDVIFTVVAYNAPVIIFLGAIPVAMIVGNGVGTPTLFLIVGAVLAVLGSGMINVSASMRRPGGFYAMVSAGLGKVPGLAIGFTAVLVYIFAILGAYAIGPVTLSGFLETQFGIAGVPWWAIAIVYVGIIGVIGYLNIQFSARVLYVLLGIEFLLILSYIVAVLVHGGAGGLGVDSFLPSNIFTGGFATGLLFVVLCFGGFEATVIFREEVKNPDRTIKRATYGTIALIALVYGLLTWAFVNAYGADTIMTILFSDYASAAAASVREYVGEWGFLLANVLLVTSTIAALVAAHNILARYVFNFAKDGILPATLGSTHPRHKSPYRASVTLSVVCLAGVAGMALAPVAPTALYAIMGGLLAYGMMIMLVFVAFASGVYMLRRHSSNTVHAVVMFITGVVLTALLAFATAQFELLTGLAGGAAVGAALLCWAVVVAGAVVALVLRRTRPSTYARIGREEATLVDEPEVEAAASSTRGTR